jgi:hypothetical protein
MAPDHPTSFAATPAESPTSLSRTGGYGPDCKVASGLAQRDGMAGDDRSLDPGSPELCIAAQLGILASASVV